MPDQRTTDAIRADGVNGLKIRNVSVKWAEDKTQEKWRSALYLKEVTDFEVDNFTGRQGLKTGKAPVVVLENVNDGVLRNLRAMRELKGLAVNVNIGQAGQVNVGQQQVNVQPPKAGG